jgi:hypothetical protein
LNKNIVCQEELPDKEFERHWKCACDFADKVLEEQKTAAIFAPIEQPSDFSMSEALRKHYGCVRVRGK